MIEDRVLSADSPWISGADAEDAPGEGRETRAPTLSEQRERLKGRPLQKAIIDLANRLGWMCATFPPVKTERGWRTPAGAQGKGWPDVVLVRDRVLFREVKGDTDRLRPEQGTWISALRLAGGDAGVWSPEDWFSGRVEEELRRRSA